MTPDTTQELFDLFWSLQDGSASAEDVARFEQLARQSPEIRRQFARFVAICGLMEWQRRVPANDECGMTNNDLPTDEVRTQTAPACGASGIHNSSLITHHFPFAGVLISYACAALIFAAGLAAARLWSPAADWQPLVQDTALPPLQTGNCERN